MENYIESLKQEAIEAAIKGDWDKAIESNKKIIAANPSDFEALLRLGFALFQKGEIKNAKKIYQKAIKIQPGNQITHNYLEKIKILETKKGNINNNNKEKPFLDPSLFLDIPGKTKVVSLVNLGQIKTLVKLKIGQKLFLRIKKRRVELRTENNEYVGALPDDISKRLIIFIKNKSEYVCFVKDVSKKNVDVFIKEEKKGKKIIRYLSFPKNIGEDLKMMQEDHEKIKDEDDFDQEIPIDIEELAQEIEQREIYEDSSLETDDDNLEE